MPTQSVQTQIWLIRVFQVCYSVRIFVNSSQHFIWELVVCQTGPDKQCRHRSDSFSSCSLILVFTVCYSDSIFVNVSPENQHFTRELVACQTVQTQIRQLLKKQSYQSHHCLLFCQHFCEFKPTFYLRTSCLRYSPRQTEQIQIRQLLNWVFPICYSDSIFVISSPENQHFIWELVACHTVLRQTEQIQIRQLLNWVFPVCYSNSIFVNSSPEN